MGGAWQVHDALTRFIHRTLIHHNFDTARALHTQVTTASNRIALFHSSNERCPTRSQTVIPERSVDPLATDMWVPRAARNRSTYRSYSTVQNESQRRIAKKLPCLAKRRCTNAVPSSQTDGPSRKQRLRHRQRRYGKNASKQCRCSSFLANTPRRQLYASAFARSFWLLRAYRHK